MKVKFRYGDVWKEHPVRETATDYYILDYTPRNWSCDCFVAVRKSAMEIVPDIPTIQTYRVGQLFKIGSQENPYLLACLGSREVVLISMRDGFPLSRPVVVGNVDRISVTEMEKVTYSNHYTLV